LRHGEPVGGRAFRGSRINDLLSEKGWLQMWDAVPAKIPWQHIVTSPLTRCRAFAAALAEKHGLPLTVEEDFREVGFGDWEGRTADEIIADNAGEYAAFYRDPVKNRPPGAEPLDEFIDRVTRAYEGILQSNSAQSILVIAHAGVIRAIITHSLGSPPVTMYRIRIETASFARIRIHQYGPNLELLNGQIES
ncbi:MAG: histidine phosphatase family protein, partial [Acidiferrobacterales bacterium]